MGVHLSKGERTWHFPQITGRLRLLLWFLLLSLTAVVMVFPTSLVLAAQPIQSVYIFDSLPLFTGLYSIWLALLLFLLFSRNASRKGDWEGLALACLFSLVFLGFWVFLYGEGRVGGDSSTNAAIVKYIREHGEVGDVHYRVLGYFNFPGVHLETTALGEVSGLGVLPSVALARVFMILALSVVFYLVSRLSLGSAYWAPLATIVMIQGNEYSRFISLFYPGNFALIFFGLIMLILYRAGLRGLHTAQDRLLIILALAALTVTHFTTSLTFLFVLAGLFLLRRPRLGESLASPAMLALALTLPLAWELYWATAEFEDVTMILSKFRNDLQDPVAGIVASWRSNVTESTPLWGIAIQYFWVVLTFGWGTLVGIRNLFRLRSLDRVATVEAGALLGIIIMVGTATLMSMSGEQFYRFFMYGMLFTVPIGLKFLIASSRVWKRLSLGLLVASVFALSLPTLLLLNRNVVAFGYYPYEEAPVQLLASTWEEQGRGLTVYTDHFSQQNIIFRLTNANFEHETEPPIMRNEAGLWHDIFDRLLPNFEGWDPQKAGPTLFIYSEGRFAITYYHIFGVDPSHPNWQLVQDRLAAQDEVYDNGKVHMYSPVALDRPRDQ